MVCQSTAKQIIDVHMRRDRRLGSGPSDLQAVVPILAEERHDLSVSCGGGGGPVQVQSTHFTSFWAPELDKAGYTAIFKKKTAEVGPMPFR